MTKEEILEKSRSENKNMDEREQQVELRAGSIAMAVCKVLCLLIFTVFHYVERYTIVRGVVLFIIGGTMCAQHLTRAIMLKKGHHWFIAVLYGVIFAGAAYLLTVALL